MKKLPAELRVLVYEALFVESSTHVFYVSCPSGRRGRVIFESKNQNDLAALTLTCKELRTESLPTFYSAGTLILHLNKAEAYREQTIRPLTISQLHETSGEKAVRSRPKLTLTPLRLLEQSSSAKELAKKRMIIDIGAFEVFGKKYDPGPPRMLLEYMVAFQEAPKAELIKGCNVIKLSFKGLGPVVRRRIFIVWSSNSIA